MATCQPPFTLADDVVGGGAGAVEEDLAELGGAGDLPDRTHLDARLLHRHEQIGDALVLRRLRIGAAEHEAPVGDRSRARSRPSGRSMHPLVAVDARRDICTLPRSEPAFGSE